MGLFFEKRDPDPRLVEMFRQAIAAQPPEDAEQAASSMAGSFEPMVTSLRTAYAAPQPRRPIDLDLLAHSSAEAVGSRLLGGPSFNTGRFAVALAIFFVLLGGGIGADIASLKDSSTALYALATTVFGVVLGFLGAEHP
jgi:hypothetical protein